MSILKVRGTYPAVLLVMATVLGVGGFICPAPGGTTPAASAGPIFVTVGFGAVSATPYDCTGQGTITVRPQNLTGTGGNGQEETRTYDFAGKKSSTTPNEPACQLTVNFPNKSPGTWQVTDGQVTCIANVIAGQGASVKIYNGTCS